MLFATFPRAGEDRISQSCRNHSAGRVVIHVTPFQQTGAIPPTSPNSARPESSLPALYVNLLELPVQSGAQVSEAGVTPFRRHTMNAIDSASISRWSSRQFLRPGTLLPNQAAGTLRILTPHERGAAEMLGHSAPLANTASCWYGILMRTLEPVSLLQDCDSLVGTESGFHGQERHTKQRFMVALPLSYWLVKVRTVPGPASP